MHGVQKEPNPEAWRGTELSLTIEGAWSTYRSYILRYLRQIAVITPYAQFRFEYKAVDERNSAFLAFKRRTDAMPAPPLQVHQLIANACVNCLLLICFAVVHLVTAETYVMALSLKVQAHVALTARCCAGQASPQLCRLGAGEALAARHQSHNTQAVPAPGLLVHLS